MNHGLHMAVEQRFENGPTLDLALDLPTSGFSITVLFGPSGSGKTTLLRCLAGLERPRRGVIQCSGATWFDANRSIHWSPQRRDIGFLFQEYALFPHLTVRENVGYALHKVRAKERQQRVDEALAQFGLDDLDQRLPRQISGGQQQRVALARALIRRPRLLLLDEPLSALDSSLRERLRLDLRGLLSKADIPAILVTHDRTEAISLADRVVVLDQGRVRQVGGPEQVFTQPADAAVANIVGIETVVEGHLLGIVDGLASVSVGGMQLLAVATPAMVDKVLVCIRGEDVTLQKQVASSSVRNRLEARVTAIIPEGALVRVMLDCGFPLTALITRPACQELGIQLGDSLLALIKAPSVHLVPR